MPEWTTGDQLALIAGMTVVTYLPRVLPLWLLSTRSLNAAVMRWLEMIPPAVLAALLARSLLLRGAPDGSESLFFSLENAFLLASFPAFLVAWRTKSFFGTVAVGMACVALCRAIW